MDYVVRALEGFDNPYPARWIAVKLLERDEEVGKHVYTALPGVEKIVQTVVQDLERIHRHD
ncbi:hypothetical protein GWN63_00985, partial [Candidatus Bathyarchaeota archaeon]|nr:hypothetical protein [Candidatus Bathyarchaeota archaeon]NIV67878.1 hypothetical protein [Candidatus Bathyarchaeota archaeon]NIW34086.1 hypothetical protein [Candidatus Bathyarchaeota archaeon]